MAGALYDYPSTPIFPARIFVDTSPNRQPGNACRPSLALFEVALFDNETSFCCGIPYAEGVSHQSPGSRSAPWDDDEYATQTPTGFYRRSCKTPLGFGFALFPRPRVRCATLGFVVEPRCGTSNSATSKLALRASIWLPLGRADYSSPGRTSSSMWVERVVLSILNSNDSPASQSSSGVRKPLGT
jgi:hypothetical protein